jgi:hypothetical protein
MPNPKQQLTELIEAYATARATGNGFLIQAASKALIEFLENCTIGTDVVVEPATETDGSEG